MKQTIKSKFLKLFNNKNYYLASNHKRHYYDKLKLLAIFHQIEKKELAQWIQLSQN